MLRGIDISNNNNLTWNILDNTQPDFMIHKLTEGRSFEDKKFFEHVSLYHEWCIENKKYPLLGAYHFVNGAAGPLYEANNYINILYANLSYYFTGWPVIPIIDVEGKAHNLEKEYILTLFQIIERDLGVKPLLYTSASYLPKYKYLKEQNYGLWVASYGVSKPSTGPWPFWALWQYDNGTRTGTGVDMDYFNGTQEQFLKYCYNYKLPQSKCKCTANCEKCTCWERVQ